MTKAAGELAGLGSTVIGTYGYMAPGDPCIIIGYVSELHSLQGVQSCKIVAGLHGHRHLRLHGARSAVHGLLSVYWNFSLLSWLQQADSACVGHKLPGLSSWLVWALSFLLKYAKGPGVRAFLRRCAAGKRIMCRPKQT